MDVVLPNILDIVMCVCVRACVRVYTLNPVFLCTVLAVLYSNVVH